MSASIRPKALSPAATVASAEPGSVTSSRAAMPCPPCAVTNSSVAAQSLMSAAITRAPAAARLFANSWPRPRAAPVTSTTLSPTSMAQSCFERVLLSENLVGAGVDQMHVVEVGDERHHFARLPGRSRVDAAAYLDPLDDEIDHRLHPHRLDDVEQNLEVGAAGRQSAALFDDIFRTQAEDQLFTQMRAVTRDAIGGNREAQRVREADRQTAIVLDQPAGQKIHRRRA